MAAGDIKNAKVIAGADSGDPAKYQKSDHNAARIIETGVAVGSLLTIDGSARGYTYIPRSDVSPLRVALIASSAAIATGGSTIAFNKTVPLLANAAHVAGAVIKIKASGFFRTKVAAPGDVIGFITVGGADYLWAPYTGGLTPVGVSGWHMDVDVIVRTPGTPSAVVIHGGQFLLFGQATGPIGNLYGGEARSLSTAGALTIGVAWNWSVTDALNTTTMTGLTVEVMPPGATAS